LRDCKHFPSMPRCTHPLRLSIYEWVVIAEDGKNKSTHIFFSCHFKHFFSCSSSDVFPHPLSLHPHQYRIIARKEIRQGMIGTPFPLVFFIFYFFGWFDFFHSLSYPFFPEAIIHHPLYRHHRHRPTHSVRSVPIAASSCHHLRHPRRRPASSSTPFPAPSWPQFRLS